MEQTKVCKHCNQEKTLDNFYRNSNCKDNHDTVCKQCRQKEERNKRVNNQKVLPENGVKICSKCEKELSLDHFVKDKWSKDGYKSVCKECIKEKVEKSKAPRKDKDPRKELESQGIFTKVCSVCGIEKPLVEFQKNINLADGLYSWCKECASKKGEHLRENKRKHMKEVYYPAHKEERKKYNKKYHSENKEAIKTHQKKYAEENKELIAKRRKEQWPKRRQKILEDEMLSAKAKLRSFLKDCLTRYHYKKDSHGYEILGCSYEEAWEHLKQTWKENYGEQYNGQKFHIDHIIPLSVAKSKEEVEELSRIENLQLLTPEDNLAKRDIIGWETEYRKNNKENS